MNTNVVINLSDLCKALEGSLSPNSEVRGQCEQYLVELHKKNGYRTAVLEVIKTTNSVNDNVRMAAAIFLKNSLKDLGNISKEETDVLLREIYNLLLYLEKKDKEIYSQLLQCIRMFVQKKYPDDFGIMNNILEDMDQRKDVRRLYVSLYCLKLIFKQLKLRKRELRETFEKTINTYYYPLVKCVVDLYSADINSTEVSEILCVISKLYYYIYECSIHKNEIILESIDHFFALFDQILKSEIKIENYIDDEQHLKTVPQYKCKRIVLNIVITFIAKFVNKNYNNYANELTQKICEIFLSKWVAVYYEDIILALNNYHKDKRTLTNECLCLLLQGLSYGLESADVYNVYIKSNIDFIIRNIVFPILCYSTKEMEDVLFDEYNYAVNIFNSFSFTDTKSYASDFLKDLTRYRGTKHIPQLCQFCETVLNTYNTNYSQIYAAFQNSEANTMNNSNVAANCLEQNQEALLNNEFCKYKFGALKILECISSRLCDKKRNMNIEDFLKTYIENDLDSKHVLLCHESIVLYCTFIRKCTSIVDENRLLYNYQVVLNHMGSSSLLLRATSAAYMRHFFKFKNARLKAVIIESIPVLIKRMLSIIKEAKFELILMSLESLTYSFKDYITPYINDVVATLCNSYVHLVKKKDEEVSKRNALRNAAMNSGWTHELVDTTAAGLVGDVARFDDYKKGNSFMDEEDEEDEDLNSACMSILTAILNLLESVDEENKAEIYKSTLPWLYVVIDESFKMPTFEHFEEAIVLLTNITYYLDIDQGMYLRFERLFDIYYFNDDEEMKKQELEFMRANQDYILSPFFDAPFRKTDPLYEFILDVSYAVGFIDNLCSKNVEQFVTLHSTSHSIKYVHMIFRLAVEAWKQKVRRSSMKLLFVLFEGNVHIKGIDELLAPVLNLVHHGLLENDRMLKEIKEKEEEDNRKKEEKKHNASLIDQNRGKGGEQNSDLDYDSDDTMESELYGDDILSATVIEHMKQLLYAIIVYDTDNFFYHFTNNGAISYILSFISVLDNVKHNKTRRMYILAMSRILQKVESPHIAPHVPDLNAFIVNLTLMANTYYENKQVADKMSSSDESEDTIDCNSEMEIDDNEDATNEKACKLIKKLEDIKRKNMAAVTQNNAPADMAAANVPGSGYFDASNANTNNAATLCADDASKKQQDNNLKQLLKKEDIDEDSVDDDEDSDYEYDDSSEDSDDDERVGLFDELNAFQMVHDIVTGFYQKYQNLYNAEVVQKLQNLCHSEAQDAMKKLQEEESNK